MAKAARTRVAAPIVSDEELDGIVREAIATKPGLSSAKLTKALPKSHQRLGTRPRAALARLVTRGEIHEHPKGKTPLFFTADPMLTLDRVVREVLARGTADLGDLTEAVEDRAAGHGQLLKDWLKTALARGIVFEQLPVAPGKKRFGPKPDLRLLLKKELATLKKALPALDRRGVSRTELARALLGELGVSPESLARAWNGASSGDPKAELVAELRSLTAANPEGALLLVRELRARTTLSKAAFDRAVLELAHDGTLSLHYHDHAASLPEAERRELVHDGSDGYYGGIALRGG